MTEKNDNNIAIRIVQHAMIGALHWYVIGDNGNICRKFNHIEDAKDFALTLTLPENIEIIDI